MSVPFGAIRGVPESDVEALVGKTVTRSEHFPPTKNSDERLVLTFSDGFQLSVVTAEYMHITINYEETT